MIISICHELEVCVVDGGEGTSYYTCSGCHAPCDTKCDVGLEEVEKEIWEDGGI